MANEFYNRGANFNPDELADGDAIESEFDAVARGFDKINTAIDTDRAGYPTQAFHVAPATEPTHAVQKAQLESALELKADTSSVNTALALKADTSSVNTALALKADASSVNSALALKADASSVNSRIGSDGGISFRNKIIDGRFDFWYEGTSQTSSGYGSDTMWQNNHNVSTKVHSQQLLTTGVDLPSIDYPTAKYFSRTVVTSTAGAANYVIKAQSIESVSTLAGKTVTVSFYAKADSVKNIALELYQYFGSTGSTAVSNPLGLVSLSTSWQRFSKTITLPSISGKTIGAQDILQLCFWFDAGINFAARSSSLGQQSGTFDIACVQLEEGSVMTPFEELPIEVNQMRVNRYYEQILLTGTLCGAYRGSTASMETSAIIFKVSKRAPPTITAAPSSISNFVDTGYASSVLTAISGVNITSDSASFNATSSVVNPGTGFRYVYFGHGSYPSTINADARL